MQEVVIPTGSRSCSRCGEVFPSFGKEYVCPTCRGAKPREKMRGQGNMGLTPREAQIEKLVSQAKSNKQIAYELCLTEGTVKIYLLRIFRKAKVNTRTELAIMVLRRDG